MAMIDHPGPQRTFRRGRTLFTIAAISVVAVTLSVFVRGSASAASAGTTYDNVTWEPQSAQIIDTGTDCAVIMTGSIEAPDEAGAKQQGAVLRDQKPVSVNKDGIQRFTVLSVNSRPKRLSTGSYAVSVSGAAVMDCAAVRAPQPARTLTGASLASDGGAWKRQALGALAGIAIYFALTTVLTAALVAAGLEAGGTA